MNYGDIVRPRASVMKAVVDVLSEYGITHFDMPASPPRAWEAIRKNRRQA